jgi:4-amino-4-deoxy-L-arabinose transferase-like glycosyltransferase
MRELIGRRSFRTGWSFSARALARPLLPILVFALLAGTSLARKSATYDEAVLLTSGAMLIRTWDNGLTGEFPPLLKAFYALPTLFFPSVAVPEPPDSQRYSYVMGPSFDYGNVFLFGQSHPLLLLFCCRMLAVTLACGLGFLVYATAARIWDKTIAIILLWVFALSPNLLAHARLLTTDTGCSLFIFLTTVTLYLTLSRGRPRDVLLCGVALAGALLSKFTGLLPIPSMVLQTGLYVALTRQWGRLHVLVGRLMGAGLVVLLMINLSYGFSGVGHSLAEGEWRSELVKNLAALPLAAHIPLPIPEGYIKGFDIVAYNNRPGFPNIFLGQYYPAGGSWWYYYLVVLGLKLPLPFLIALVLGTWFMVRDRHQEWAAVSIFLIPPLLLFLNFSFVAYRQLGLRYVLPLWPFMILGLGFLAERMKHRWNLRSVRWAAGMLGAWYVVSLLLVAPNYLTFFNELAGGSASGWRYLADSNVDWGQDLPALAAWQEEQGHPAMYVIYHGTAPLSAYGVKSQKLGTPPLPAYVAISVTSYYLARTLPLVAFLKDHRRPLERLGNSIHVYALDQSVVDDMARGAARRGS